jgi:hypothetical protein
MFELETRLKQYDRDTPGDTDVPLTVDEAREVVRKFIVLRQTLRRIVSLDEKNVPKMAQQIAQDGLRQTHE